MILFKNAFDYETPDEMLEYLDSLKTIDKYNQETFLIENSFQILEIWLKICQQVMRKTKNTKLLNIVDKILNFTLKERKQEEKGLKILKPNQMLSR